MTSLTRFMNIDIGAKVIDIGGKEMWILSGGKVVEGFQKSPCSSHTAIKRFLPRHLILLNSSFLSKFHTCFQTSVVTSTEL